MCLSKVTKTYKYTGPKIFHPKTYKIGWKVILDNGGGFSGIYYSNFCTQPFNTWIICRQTIDTTPYINYTPGFHIFLNKEDAENWCSWHCVGKNNAKVVKTRYRHVVAEGYQTGSDDKCVVAKQIYIPNTGGKLCV